MLKCLASIEYAFGIKIKTRNAILWSLVYSRAWKLLGKHTPIIKLGQTIVL